MAKSNHESRELRNEKDRYRRMKEALQEKSIKAIFNSFDYGRQVTLIEDLMRLAKVDSIIRIDQPSYVCGTEVNTPKNETETAKKNRLYRQSFDAWLYPALIKWSIVVKKSFVDECFELFQFIRVKAKGSAYARGATGFCIYDNTNSGSLFADEAERDDYCCDILANESIENIAIHAMKRDGNRSCNWTMKFSKLFIIHCNEDVKPILLCFGFFDDDEVLKSKVMVEMRQQFFQSLSEVDAAAAVEQVLFNGQYALNGVLTTFDPFFKRFPGLLRRQ